MALHTKLSIFIGSTKDDLSAHRQAVIQAILEAGHIPSGTELWSAGHIPTRDAIREHLQLCDIHIVVLGGRYGSYVSRRNKSGSRRAQRQSISTEDPEISFVEWEYSVSKRDGRPVIAFLLEKDEFKDAIENIDSERDRKKLIAFRKTLESNAVCKTFSQKESKNLGLDCVNAINEAINSGKLAANHGWIRTTSKRGQVLQSVENNIFLQRILDRFYRFSTLTARLDKGPEAKRNLGRVFWDQMFSRIKRAGYNNLFFESGSTLAFVSDEFESIISNAEEDSAKWNITTNNALTLLQFLLDTHMNVNPRPAGAPEDYYGAMFDDVLLQNPEPPPRVPRKLFPEEVSAIERTVDTLQGDGKRRLYLMTASGLDFDNDEPHFRGPHVGSHPNMLFKRAILHVDQPTVLFLSGWKLAADFRFKVGKCFPVCGPDFTWETACKECRLAICVGYAANLDGSNQSSIVRKKHRLMQQFECSEFDHFDKDYASQELDNGGAFIIANDGFKEVFPKQ